MSRAYWCDGKHGFESRALAEKVVRRRRQPGSIYRCSLCRLWHVGSSIKRAWRRT
jgi:hypothetical protein